jgi:Holliday junction resolvasome RuvABC endonuclease subunit
MILGLDPSLTGFGWAVVGADLTVIDCGVICTKPIAKKRGIRVMDSQCQRSDEILRELDRAMMNHRPRCVVAEGPVGSKSVKAATALERSNATWQAWAYCLRLPRVMVTAGDVKRACTGLSSCDKELVAQGVRRVSPNAAVAECIGRIAPKKREHVYDAIGAVIAAWDSDVVRMARQTK